MSQRLALGVAVLLLTSTWCALGAPSSVELVLEEGTNFAVAVSPDGSQMVIDLQGTLWLLSGEGGEAEAFTDGLGDDRLPDWSRDGSRIVFQSFRSGSWDIWAISPDGSDLEALTDSSFDDREPVWSPDSKQVAFSSDRSGNYDIWALDLESRDLTQLTHHEANDYMPTWSPDGATMAFVSERGGGEGRATELWKIKTEDAQVEKIAAFDGAVASPSWSPDGSRLSFHLSEQQSVTLMGARFQEGLSTDLATLPAEGGEVTRLGAGKDVFPFRPAWTKEGALVFTADGQLRRLIPGETETEAETVPFLAKVELERPADRKRKIQIPEPGSRRPVRGIVRPIVSPNGDSIAFTALGDLWVVPVGGGTPVAITRDQYLDSDPSWSPDGRYLVFASDRGGTMDLWVKEIGSSPKSGERRLTAFPGAEIGPAWSPDGSTIAYLDARNDLYVMPAEGGDESRLVHKARRWAGLPSWSSDGEHIALSVHRPFSTRFREGANRILVVSIDSGEERILDVPDKSFGTRDGDGPVWSPDGMKMAFALDGGVWVVDVTPSGELDGSSRKVFDEAADFMSWFPDSGSLLCVVSDELERVDIESGTSEVVPLSLDYEVLAGAGKLLIQGARLIDGTGAPPRDGVDILIEGGRIESIEPGPTELAEDVRVVDAKGKTVIPGLIESHTHLVLPAWGSRHGRLWLAYGVTSVRSPSASLYRILEERESIESGRRIGPRIFFTGYAFDGDRIYYTGYLAIDSVDELEKELHRAVKLDYDLIKTYVRLPDALQKKVVEEAQERGIFVSSHEIYPAAAYSIDGVEHVRGASRHGFSPKVTELRRSYGDVIELINRSGVYFAPTLLIQGGSRLLLAREPGLYSDERLAALYPPWAATPFLAPSPGGDVGAAEAFVEPLLDTVKAVAQGKGKLIAGTDSPIVPYGLSLILEIELISEAGFGPLEAIRSATEVAAEALGISDDLGTVEEGKIADLVILAEDPTQDIRNLRKTEMVVLGGRLVKLSQLLRQ